MKVNIFWFRRDLRLDDNAGLYHALKSGNPVLPVFIFDTEILDKLEDNNDARVEFIYNTLKSLNDELADLSSSLLVLHGKPVEIWKELVKKYDIGEVYTNHDYEPYAIKRDEEIGELLKKSSVSFHTYKDQVIFEKDEVVKADGKPYTVFTPYSNAWLKRLNDFYEKPYPTKKYFVNFHKHRSSFPSLKQLGFETSEIDFPPRLIKRSIIKKYHTTRDFPAIDGTSHLSLHLRFGTVSIRKLVQEAEGLNSTWLKELIWREFFMMILYHFPYSAEKNFRSEYDKIQWRNNKAEFAAWCEGKTGYPIVDAGMRELNRTGYMHNRVRMVTASFLTKHLLIDWRWGEKYFARKLLDYEMSSNVGNWQWAAGTGCDSAPYFRIFNPELQMKRFDSKGEYIKKWVPEISGLDYPTPIVEHKFARERALAAYKSALGK